MNPMFFGVTPVDGVIVVDGDSNTAHVDTGTVLADQKWPYVMAGLKGTGHSIVDLAVSGSSGGHTGYDLSPTAPLYAIMTGTNILRLPGGTAADVLALVQAQVAAVRAVGVQRIVVFTVPNCGAIVADPALLAQWHLYRDLCVAGATGADRVLDLQNVTFALQVDQLHLTVADHVVLAGLAVSVFNSLL